MGVVTHVVILVKRRVGYIENVLEEKAGDHERDTDSNERNRESEAFYTLGLP